MREIHQALTEAIITALKESEQAGDLVISTQTPIAVAERISESARSVFSGGIFSPAELMALSALILHATADKRFYDWEMPTLTGYTAEEMQELGQKIRALVAL